MDDRFGLLQEIVLGRVPDGQNHAGFPELSHQRLVKALQGPTPAGAKDLTGLVRHVLRREEARQGWVPQQWWVPKVAGWPTADEWRLAGIEVRTDLKDSFRVRAQAWIPAWLPGAQLVPPCQAVEAMQTRRLFAPVDGDPWLSVMGLETYRCAAQREMLRNVLTAPPGATLLCNLPTGAGKSFLAQLPALLRSRREGLSVVVVPTTALAMDQERSVSGLVSHPTAYHPGKLPDGSDRQEEIRRRILDGTQRLLFTSPESVIGGLSGLLYSAADRGLLRFLAIDEAHIVLEWGNDFRSSFQELAGLRRDLLRHCVGEPFVTLLMSATVSQECLQTLETLFADPGPFAVSSAVQLRPEPSYWTCHCESEEMREARVLEAVHCLPRPLILYTTKRKDAGRWFQLLREVGYRRCAMVTGNTSTKKRQTVVRRWKEADLDIVVATAAFGLGVDQGDVRAVIHACVPESVDRFYQEVGRGGRDGKASLSFVFHTDRDLSIAERMSQKKLIGLKKGPARWKRMFYNKEVKKVEESLYRVPVGISPGVTADRIDMVNRRNLQWNINTLTLMSRAGVLQMDAERPPQWDGGSQNAAEEEARIGERLKRHREHRVIRILDSRHLEPGTWRDRVKPVRREAFRNSRLDLSRMRQVLQGTHCVAQILAEAYRIQVPGSGPVHVTPCCGGCSACRAQGQDPYAGPLPEPLPSWPIPRDLAQPLARLLADADAVAVFYDEVEPYEFERFLRWLVRVGVRSAVLPPELPSSLHSVAVEVLGAPTERPVFISETYHSRKAPRVPTLILHAKGSEVPRRYLPSEDGSGIPRVIFLPADATDPTSPHRLLRDVVSRKFGFSEFLLSQGL